jgi:CubicO group peptidase (beta-lactamase class C family)
MTAVEEGVLDLDWTVREAAPGVGFNNPWEDRQPLTLAMAMEHTSGFDDIHVREYAKVDDPQLTLAEGLAYDPDSRTSRWPPGMHMSYANSGPPIAAYALEQATGRLFEDYVRERVFDVLQMHNSTFYFPDEPEMMSKGYKDDGATEANYDHITIRPSGAMNSSAGEMANYLQMMINRGRFNGGRLLRPASIDRMEAPTTTLAARSGHEFGYGLGNYALVMNGHLFHGHDGGITGFVSTSAYSSELGLGFFIALNRPSGKLRDIRSLVGRYLTAGIEPVTAPVAVLGPAELDRHVGYYSLVNPRAEMTRFITRLLENRRIVAEDGKLFAKPLLGGERRELIPVTADSFRLEGEPVATQFMVMGTAGEAFWQGNFGSARLRIAAPWLFLQLGLAGLVLAALASSILFAFVWLPARLFGRFQDFRVKTALLPLLTSLLLVASLLLPFYFSDDMIMDFGKRTVNSMALFLGPMLFAALSLYSVHDSVSYLRSGQAGKAGMHALVVSLAGLAALLYLAAHGLIGMRTWAY